MKCECGFQFSGPGEFRNCEAFITRDGRSGVVCPECGINYVCGPDTEGTYVGGKEQDNE